MRLTQVVLVLLMICTTGCKNSIELNDDKTNLRIENDFTVDEVISHVNTILEKDRGKFWDYELNQPIMFVNSATRELVATVNSRDQSLEKSGSFYTGILPETVNIANTAFDWNGVRWAMVMMPLPDNIYASTNLIIHELFHVVQPEIGFSNLIERNNDHLDTFEGRLLLKLELEALKKSLISKEEAIRNTHLSNAIGFRLERYSNENFKESENALEINEGLAEYTGVMLSERSRAETIDHFIQSIDDFYINDSFIRSFAYHTIPIYGYHLSSEDPKWHLKVNASTNLTDLFIESLPINIPGEWDYLQVASDFDYNYKTLLMEENERENRRVEVIQEYLEKLVLGSVIELPFSNMNIFFDPSNLVPLKEYGTVYPNLRITDDWGILTVEEGGALINPSWSNVTISHPVKLQDNIVLGEGWKLQLQEGYKITLSGNDYILIKEQE
jgi:hypothetical protein